MLQTLQTGLKATAALGSLFAVTLAIVNRTVETPQIPPASVTEIKPETVNIIPREKPVLSENQRAEQDLQEAVRSLEKGLLYFTGPPAEMELKSTTLVTIKISRRLLMDAAIEAMGDRTKPVPEEVKVGSFMSVRLTSDGGFSIKANYPERQFLSPDDPTEWSYEVTALKSGEQRLDLAVGVRIKLPGGDEERFAPVFEKKVLVHISYVKTAKSFASDHWESLVAATSTLIVAPMILLAITNRMKRRDDEKEKAQAKKNAPIVIQASDDDLRRMKEPPD